MTCELKDIVYDVKYVDLDKKPDWLVSFESLSFPGGVGHLDKIDGLLM